MHKRMAERATAAALGLLMVCSGVAAADSVGADADVVTAGSQTMVNLGSVGAGATVPVEVGFELVCLGTSHADPGTSITLTPTTTPATGGSMSATQVTLGPVPGDWPVDGDPCIDDPVFAGGARSQVSITAPAAPGNHVFKVAYARSPSGGITGTTIAQFVLTVAVNTSPVLDLPADMTVEGNAPGGWTAAFSATATDLEDDPDPVVDCAPAPGSVLPLGLTTIGCSATDTTGATTSGSFKVKVNDTTAPVLAASPDLNAVATDPSGAAVTFATPKASDIVDGAPAVSCAPSSGSVFPIGTTPVACTATDASGNAAQGGFSVTVSRAPVAVSLTGTWGRPLAGPVPALIGHAGRTVPLKLVVRAGGIAQGPADIESPALRVGRLPGCDLRATPTSTVDAGRFAWDGEFWQLNLDTSGIGGGCFRVTAGVAAVDVASALIVLVPGPAAIWRRR